tara:strand:+ start:1740 stop:1970 length:231 start_codon:yes stop_codon:yes gene_type:complete
MSENFAYNKSWEEIEEMLHRAERKQHRHLMALQNTKLKKQDKLHHMKQYKGLEGVINGLRWVLGDKDMDVRTVLGQ